MEIGTFSAIAYTKKLCEEHLVPTLPPCKIIQYNQASVVIAYEPLEPILKATQIYLDRSLHWIKVFHFVQPLVVPQEYFFSVVYIDKELIQSWWHKDERDIQIITSIRHSIQRKIVRYLRTYSDISVFAKRHKSIFGRYHVGHAYDAELFAYSEVMLGNYSIAARVIEQGLEILKTENYAELDKDSRESSQEEQTRLLKMKSLLLTDPALAKQQVQDWIDYTITQLKLK